MMDDLGGIHTTHRELKTSREETNCRIQIQMEE